MRDLQSENIMILKRILAATGLTVACAACCAPLLWPLVTGSALLGAGAAGSSNWLGLGTDEAVCLGLAVAALAGFSLWLSRRRSLARVTACDVEQCQPAQTRNEAVSQG